NAALLARLDEAERFLTSGQRLTGDLQFLIKFEQIEVGGGDITHECCRDGFAVFFSGEQVGASGFGRATQPAPDVDLKREQIEQDSPERAFAAGPSGQRELTAAGISKGRHIEARRDVRKLFRSCDPQIGARRVDPRDGLAQIVIINESGSDQLLKLFILEDLEPLQIRQRTGIGRRDRVGGSAEDRRPLNDRSAVLRADGAAGQQPNYDSSTYQSFLHLPASMDTPSIADRLGWRGNRDRMRIEGLVLSISIRLSLVVDWPRSK